MDAGRAGSVKRAEWSGVERGRGLGAGHVGGVQSPGDSSSSGGVVGEGGVGGRFSQMKQRNFGEETVDEGAWHRRQGVGGQRMSPIVSCVPSVDNSPMASFGETEAVVRMRGGGGSELDLNMEEPIAVSVIPPVSRSGVGWGWGERSPTPCVR